MPASRAGRNPREIREAIESKATQRVKVGGPDSNAVKVEVKLGAGDPVGALREIYGLTKKDQPGDSG